MYKTIYSRDDILLVSSQIRISFNPSSGVADRQHGVDQMALTYASSGSLYRDLLWASACLQNFGICRRRLQAITLCHLLAFQCQPATRHHKFASFSDIWRRNHAALNSTHCSLAGVDRHNDINRYAH